ncbi:hypothetical protein M1513_01165, partial [Patescibacteria group bacterium]|nr:hypothetical protein [Patescibacteria group bacterium]
MPGFFKKILGIDQLSRLKPILSRINGFEEEIKKLKDEEIKLRFLKLKEEFSAKNREDLLVEAFALAREAAENSS